MKRYFAYFSALILFFSIGVMNVKPVFAQTTSDASSVPKAEFFKGKVVQIVDESKTTNEDGTFYTQVLKVERQDTHEKIDIQYGSDRQPLNENQRLQTGTQVILSKQQVLLDQPPEYVIVDTYRLDGMLWLVIGFFVLVLLIAQKQGFFSIIGMFLSVGVLLGFVVPQIIHGANPVFITLIGSGTVAVLSIYLSHGFNLHSHIALTSMLLSLVAVGVLSYGAVHIAHLSGLGSEEASYLQFGSTAKVNLQGLLLAGIMIGALGVLDDITLAQASIVDQLHQAKPHITFVELYNRGLTVGKDHVASLVNTLILAYAAGSLPLFLLFTIYDAQPAWVTLNREIIAEEVVRTITGSIGLVLAVPLSTFIACYIFMRYGKHHSKSSHVH
jgi:uncharacterized membrane protein